mmetsp:Transcript_1057/g.2432  ORF Transcript_1057/g.2432 Transcript_1057/m.2432 type:complete len:216 (-) Transcript_1057:972-1619(-)
MPIPDSTPTLNLYSSVSDSLWNSGTHPPPNIGTIPTMKWRCASFSESVQTIGLFSVPSGSSTKRRNFRIHWATNTIISSMYELKLPKNWDAKVFCGLLFTQASALRRSSTPKLPSSDNFNALPIDMGPPTTSLSPCTTTLRPPPRTSTRAGRPPSGMFRCTQSASPWWGCSRPLLLPTHSPKSPPKMSSTASAVSLLQRTSLKRKRLGRSRFLPS